MASGKVYPNVFVIEEHETSEYNITANGTVWGSNENVSKTGYKPLGTVGYYIIGTSGVVGLPYCSYVDNGYLNVAFKNLTANAGTIKGRFRILYIPT